MITVNVSRVTVSDGAGVEQRRLSETRIGRCIQENYWEQQMLNKISYTDLYH